MQFLLGMVIGGAVGRTFRARPAIKEYMFLFLFITFFWFYYFLRGTLFEAYLKSAYESVLPRPSILLGCASYYFTAFITMSIGQILTDN